MGLVLAGCYPVGPADESSEVEDVSVITSPVVGGSATADYLAVPQLRVTYDNGAGGNCTGTLVSPKVVLTAAHCVDAGPDVSVSGIEVRFGPTSSTNSSAVEVIQVADFFFFSNWSLEADDIALLLLERDAVADPIPFNTTGLTGGDLGRTMTFVGWGITSGGGTDSGVKRVGSAPLTSFQSSVVLRYGDTNSATCSGDSGGPGFMTVGGTQKIVSVTSFTTNDCDLAIGGAGGVRVAAYKDVIANYIADNDLPVLPEVAFTEPQDGASIRDGFQIRVDATDDTRVERVEIFINGEISSTSTSAPYADFGEGLAPGPATIEARAYDNRGDMTSATINVDIVAGSAVGETCGGNEDCASDLCATLDSQSLCTQLCTSDDECPEGAECRDDAGACWPVSDSGGCRASGSPDLSALAFGLVLLLLVRRRRR